MFTPVISMSDVYARNLDVIVTEHIEHFYILQQFLQFHIA